MKMMSLSPNTEVIPSKYKNLASFSDMGEVTGKANQEVQSPETLNEIITLKNFLIQAQQEELGISQVF